jgi:Uma2 family endonuclease
MYALSQPIQLDFNPAKLTDEQFYSLYHNNPDLNIERNAQGIMILLPPADGNSGIWEMGLGGELSAWNRQSVMGLGNR